MKLFLLGTNTSYVKCAKGEKITNDWLKAGNYEVSHFCISLKYVSFDVKVNTILKVNSISCSLFLLTLECPVSTFNIEHQVNVLF